MPKTLLIQGNFPQSDNAKDGHQIDEVWCINDWWRVRPCLMPDRVYQMHEYVDPNNRTIHSGWWEWFPQVKKLVCARTHGLPNEEVAPIYSERWNKYPHSFYGSTLGYMFADAIREGFNTIILDAVRLDHQGEYEYQFPSLLLNIDEARANGIKVLAKWEPQWQMQRAVVDWKKVKDVAVRYGDTLTLDKSVNLMRESMQNIGVTYGIR